MDKNEALERLKLIETMVSEQRGSAIESGRGLMWLGGIGAALLFLGYGLQLKSMPDEGRLVFALLGLALIAVGGVWEWRRYRRFRAKPTLAYRVYLALMLGSFFFLAPIVLLEHRGLLHVEAGISLMFALMALSFAVYRPILGYRWLDGFALLWFAASCLSAGGYTLDPILMSSVLMAFGMALPGWLMYRDHRSQSR